MKRFGKTLSYILVGVCASLLTLLIMNSPRVRSQTDSKLDQLAGLIDTYFIEDVDMAKVEDAAAKAMVASLGDRWSTYLTASEFARYQERSQNAYVGIGITVEDREDKTGLNIVVVEPGAPAEEAGVREGDILTAVAGQRLSEIGLQAGKDLIRGKEGTEVSLTVLRDGEELALTATRKRFETPVAVYEMLDSGYGFIRIENFESKCAKETIAAIEDLMDQGAKGLIFDVRFNPGGYKHEMVEVLDYLLPEGPVFRSLDYRGKESVEESDADCLDVPIAVLVNKDSYSAAEFFAAALREYDWAIVVGQPTSGKGYFQSVFPLPDGSAASISMGKYFTPDGLSLAGVGIQPDVDCPVDEDTYKAIARGKLEKNEDPQLQAAISALNSAE